MTFINDVKNKHKDDEIQLPWPEFPYKKIEEWFSLVPEQKIYYYCKDLPLMHVIYIMKKEYPEQNPIEISWPDIPIQDFENWLGINNGHMVGYLPSGLNKISCVGVGRLLTNEMIAEV